MQLCVLTAFIMDNQSLNCNGAKVLSSFFGRMSTEAVIFSCVQTIDTIKLPIIGIIVLNQDEMNTAIDSQASEYFHMLPEKMCSFQEKLVQLRICCCMKSFNQGFNLIFKSGICQNWRFQLKKHEYEMHDRADSFIENEKYLLTIDDIYGIFYFLLMCRFTCPAVASGQMLIVERVFIGFQK